MASVHVHRDNIRSILSLLSQPPTAYAEQVLIDQINVDVSTIVRAYEDLLFGRESPDA